MHLDEGTGDTKEAALTAVQQFGGMLYADDVGILSQSSEGLAQMMAVVVEVCEAFGLTVSEKKNRNHVLANTVYASGQA